MNKFDNRIIWGGLLILLGIVFLLQELGLLGNAFQFLWILLMAGGGLVFIYVFISKKDQWWAAIPGMALLGLALTAGSDELNLDLGGWLFLGSLGLGFWLVYIRQTTQWWAMIPGGVLVTLAVVAGLDGILDGGAIFFLGLAGTFALVAVLPSDQVDTRWAFIPAAGLAVLGLSLGVSIPGSVLNLLIPSLIILAGGYLLIKNILN
jgi:hypothetical protein